MHAWTRAYTHARTNAVAHLHVQSHVRVHTHVNAHTHASRATRRLHTVAHKARTHLKALQIPTEID